MSILVYGAKGWIGGKIVEILQQTHPSYNIVEGKARLENIEQVENEVNEIQASDKKLLRVINCAGRTGTPNVDWCENNRDATVMSNIVGPIILASVLQRQSPPVHLTYIGSGCIYEYDETHKMPSLEDAANPPRDTIVGFKEEEEHNYLGSFYSFTKSTVENVLHKTYPNITLTLRMRMPISDDLHPRSLITKLLKYKKVIDVPNSMSVLSDLLPIAVDMCIAQKIGVYNFTNPGTISHTQILSLYKQYVDPQTSWETFSVEEQDRILLARRSNNYLDSSKLQSEYPHIPTLSSSIESLFIRLANSK